MKGKTVMGQTLDVVNTFYDLTNHQRQTKGMEQLITEDMSFWGPLQTVSGANAYIALNEQLLQFHAGVEMVVQIEDGDSVCSIYDLLMKSPAGETFAIPMVDWLRVVNGRIAEQRVYYDPRTFLEAFGM
jgi:ketosteroid isomerase-like protein